MKTLEKWKRNQVFEAVQAVGLSPQGFIWDEADDDICLRHPSSQAYFVFGGGPGSYLTRWQAGDDTRGDVPRYSWHAIMRSVELWLVALKRDVGTPDLWDQLQGQTELLAGSSDEGLENTPFTPAERDELIEHLNEIRRNVKSAYALSETQQTDLDSKLDYLIDAASRLGRKDWLNAGIGAMFGWFLVAALPPEAPRQILQMLLGGIANFFGHGFPGLGSG